MTAEATPADRMAGVSPDRDAVAVTIAGHSYRLTPDVARAFAKALRVSADKADEYARAVRLAAQGAVPLKGAQH